MPTAISVPSFYINPTREDFVQDADMLTPLPPREWFVFDSGALLPAAGTSDDLGYYQGTFGTHIPYVGTGDFKAATVTRKARIMHTVRAEYVLSGALYIRAKAGMVTTVADTSATIDFSAYKANGSIITGSDLVTTAAVSINSLTWEDKDFALDSSGLAAGDELDIQCTIAGVDAATATAVIAAFRAFIGCTIQG